MSLVKATKYAPDIYEALRGILLVHKPSGINSFSFIQELKDRISNQLNDYEPRPLEKRLVIDGDFGEEKRIIEIPNLADHPLVVGPRYNPWEVRMVAFPTFLTSRISGIMPLLIGSDIKYFLHKFKRTKLACVYHITGRFGFTTDNMFSDGKVIDKSTFKHIKSWKIDGVLSKIEAAQKDRLFEASAVPLDSEQAYRLAVAWPSRPPKMARWPVIYRIRCIHLDLPKFKIEVTVINENEKFLAHLCRDIGMALRSSAYTESIRRVKHGPFDISDCLTNSEWDLQSIINNLKIYADHRKMHNYLNELRLASAIRTEHDVHQVPLKIAQHQEACD